MDDMTAQTNLNQNIFKMGIYRFPPEQILLLIGDRNYTKMILLDGSIWVSSKTLSIYEKETAVYGFVRVHKSFIINKMYIEKVTKKYVKLKYYRDNIPLSRRRKYDLG
jgi:two-component system, LytTR family, response regulator